MADRQQCAKRYEAVHNWLFVVETLYTVALLLAFLFSGASRALADAAGGISANPWIAVAVYGAVVVVGMKLMFLPLNWFGAYRLEHRYGLSNESLGGWLRDEVKSLGLNLLLGVAALEAVYFLLRRAGPWWWVGAGALFLLFGVVLSALFPVLILPMFYKLRPLQNESLRQKLLALAERVGAKVVGVYRIAMSEKTKKANAAFAGLGRTRRVLLGDTLLEKFEEAEIEVVMAHEMAHYKHGDVWKLILWGAASAGAGLWVADRAMRWLLPRLGFERMSDVAALPVLALCLFVFGLVVMPVRNAFLRWRERKADALALRLTGNREAFVRAMRKLAELNLADPSPHPVVEFLLHDHPSPARRIAWAERWQRD
jgi:STE24 endopeptidase